jgi:hypothetical protein
MHSSATLPAQCALAIALPLSETEFFADASRAAKDFVPRWLEQHQGWDPRRVWQRYEPYARFALHVAAQTREAGVLVRLRASLADWAGLLRERHAVALFAHLCGEAGNVRVEFADGLHPMDELLAAIPADHGGTLDLTVCNSLELVRAIKTRCPRCTVISNKREARLDYRLAIYRQAVQLLATRRFSYVDALAEVQLAVLQHARVAPGLARGA